MIEKEFLQLEKGWGPPRAPPARELAGPRVTGGYRALNPPLFVFSFLQFDICVCLARGRVLGFFFGPLGRVSPSYRK